MTIKEVKEWLDQFPEDAKVQYKIDCGCVFLFVMGSHTSIGTVLDFSDNKEALPNEY